MIYFLFILNMSAKLGLSLPIGTKVRRKRDGMIIERWEAPHDDEFWVGFSDDCQDHNYYRDKEWEHIEENQTDEKPQPKQWDMIEIMVSWEWTPVTFVCFYEWAVVYAVNQGILARKEAWRFPPKKIDVTLQEIADWKWVDKNLINIIND